MSEYSNAWIDMRHDTALNSHVREAPSGPAARPAGGLSAGPDGMYRWVGILASLVTDHPDSQP